MIKHFAEKMTNGIPREYFVAWLCALMLFSFSAASFAQGTRSISGNTVDATDETVMGATVKVLG